MLNNFLQIVTAEPTSLSIFELMLKGGPVMIPILLLSIISVYITFERYLYLRAAASLRKDFTDRLGEYIKAGDIKGAQLFVRQTTSATGSIISVGLQSIGRPIKEIDTLLESATNIEIGEMEKNLGYLGIIAGVAPMLGFIGTISGIIHIFYNISLSDNISIGIIAGGLYEKMISSGSGLVVGVCAYSAYHLLQQKIGNFTLQIQKTIFEFMRSINTSH
jgi:biopolymer transport protein ExbB